LVAAHRKAGTLDRWVDCRESYAGVIVVVKPLVLSSSAVMPARRPASEPAAASEPRLGAADPAEGQR
jgi:hypothetical protein